MNICIAVMDYSNCVIRKYTAFVKADEYDILQNEDVENWLYDHADYDAYTCSFMFAPSDIEVINC